MNFSCTLSRLASSRSFFGPKYEISPGPSLAAPFKTFDFLSLLDQGGSLTSNSVLDINPLDALNFLPSILDSVAPTLRRGCHELQLHAVSSRQLPIFLRSKVRNQPWPITCCSV